MDPIHSVAPSFARLIRFLGILGEEFERGLDRFRFEVECESDLMMMEDIQTS